MVQFLSQEFKFVDFVEWIENELCSEEHSFLAVQEKNIPHEEKVTELLITNQHTPQEKHEGNKIRASIFRWDGITSSFTMCWPSVAKERRLP